MKINHATINLVKEFEGCYLTSYRDPVGVWTIGYGLTTGALPDVVVREGMQITQEQAEAYLLKVLRHFADQILPMFTRKPTENEFGAMLSLAYNIGVGAFGKSTCLKRFNAGDIVGAAEALQWFNKAGGRVLRGLTRRRTAEAELMLRDTKAEVEPTPQADAERGATGLSTLRASTVAKVGVTAGPFAAEVLDADWKVVAILAVTAVVVVMALLWIDKERIIKWRGGDR